MVKKSLKQNKVVCKNFANIYTTSIHNQVVNNKDDSQQICPLIHCYFLPSLMIIPENCFSDLKQPPDVISVPITVNVAHSQAFSNCEFNYIYQTNGNKTRIFSKQPLAIKDVSCSASIDEIKKVFPNIKNEDLVQITNLHELMEFTKKMSILKTGLPFEIFCKLKAQNMLHYFTNNCYFKFFNKELLPYFDKIALLPQKEQTAFFSFAYALGCFTKQFIVDDENKKTESLFCHKASNLLARLLSSNTLKLGEFHKLFSGLSFNVEPNQNFYNFLSAQNGKNNFINAKILMNNSEYYKDYFMKVMLNFEKAKTFKTTLDTYGQPIELPWETALNIFYHAKEYKGITKENSVMAKIYGNHGIKQKVFSEACNIFEKAKLDGVPHHILGKPLKEINDGTKLFTYEFLDKYNPKNAILGLYCSCCATIASEYYGKKIAIASVVAPDVQNIVIRDIKGSIIGKGTMYVNSKKGYAVINDFEIAYKYRPDCEISWQNDETNNSPNHNQVKRKNIFDTFLRAVNDFKTEYDKQHPEKPLKKVVVGIGFNKLHDICDNNLPLSTVIHNVPKKYSFVDAEYHQYLLLGKNKPKPTEQKSL